jgi:cysteine synthase A
MRYNNILETIGKTPLVRINRINNSGNIFAKLEYYNPLSSVKDRIGAAMIADAEKKGSIKPGDLLVEPTSGNTGIALAFAAAVKGYRLILTMPDTMSVERRKLLRYLGAEIVLTEGKLGMKGAVERASAVAKEHGGTILGQFDNHANPEAHYNTTGPEIWEDMQGKVDFFVAGVGTGGTLTGAGAFLKEKNPGIKIVAVEPDDSPFLSEGKAGPHKIQGIGAGFKPSILNMQFVDEIIRVKSGDAIDTARQLAQREGIFTGISAGANMWAGLQVAARPQNAGKSVVTIMCDTGERYLSTALFEGIEA